MGAEDQFGSFILHSLFLYPFISYLLAPHPTRRWLGVVLACVVMSAFAYFTVFYGQERANYYELLGVTRDVSGVALKKAFKRLSLLYHPDKNRAGTEVYNALKTAYDVLGNADLRRAYDIAGVAGVQAIAQTTLDSKYFILQILMHLFFSGFSTFLITVNDSSGICLQAGLVTLAIIVSLEIAVCILTLPVFPPWLLPHWTPFDILHVLRQLYPTFLSATRSFVLAFHKPQAVARYLAASDVAKKIDEHCAARSVLVSKLFHLQQAQESAPKVEMQEGIAAEAMRCVPRLPADSWDIATVSPSIIKKRSGGIRRHLFQWMVPVVLYIIFRIGWDRYYYSESR